MKFSELSDKSPEEMKLLLLSLRKTQFRYRMQRATSQLTQTHLLGQVKSDIARVKTAIRQSAGDNHG